MDFIGKREIVQDFGSDKTCPLKFVLHTVIIPDYLFYENLCFPMIEKAPRHREALRCTFLLFGTISPSP